MKFLASMKIKLFVVRISKIQKKSFADVLQNRCSWKFRNVHRKAPVLESLFNKHAGLKTCNFFKKRLKHVFSCKICDIFKNTFFTEHIWWQLLEISHELSPSPFIAFGNYEWCHFVVRIGSLALISFYDVRFVSF